MKGNCACSPGFSGDACEATVKVTTYYWVLMQFNGCSKGCGGGSQTRDIHCWEKKGSKIAKTTDDKCSDDIA